MLGNKLIFSKAILPFVRRVTMKEVTMRRQEDQDGETFTIQFQDYTRFKGTLKIAKEKGRDYVVKEATGQFERHEREISHYVSTFNPKVSCT